MPQYEKRRKLVIAGEGKSVNIIMFDSTGDFLELFASEGDVFTSTGDSFCSVTSIRGRLNCQASLIWQVNQGQRVCIWNTLTFKCIQEHPLFD